MIRTGSTAELRDEWAAVADLIGAARDRLMGDAADEGVALWLNGESSDYRTLVAMTVVRQLEIAHEIARAEAQTVIGDD
jgi:hypothetical protein